METTPPCYTGERKHFQHGLSWENAKTIDVTNSNAEYHAFECPIIIMIEQ